MPTRLGPIQVGLRGWGFESWSGTDPALLENVRFLAGLDVHEISVGDVGFG